MGLFLSKEPEGFVTVKGSQLIYNGKPYFFAGANLWYGCYIGSPGRTGDRPRLIRELDSLVANGVQNLRILAASEESSIKRSVRPAIQSRPGVVDDSLLAGLDFLLAEMAGRRMHAVLYLTNYWEWSGGMAQYNVWADGGEGVDPEDPSREWGAFMDFSARFYGNLRANAMYRDYIRELVLRTNSVNGRQYAADPTIMAWQLANEPRPGSLGPEAEAQLPVYLEWINNTAEFIHSLDTNHLVSSGSEGTVAFRWSPDVYLQAHRSKCIDYLTVHCWPKNWDWFDPARGEETLPIAEEKSIAYFNAHVALARLLGKPLVIEEFGLSRDSGVCASGSPVKARDHFFTTLLSAVYDSARAGAPVAGTNFWGWGGEGRGKNADDLWRPGDPFVADPPHEPQGYNAVFNSDRTTLAIISEHALKMKNLGMGTQGGTPVPR